MEEPKNLLSCKGRNHGVAAVSLFAMACVVGLLFVTISPGEHGAMLEDLPVVADEATQKAPTSTACKDSPGAECDKWVNTKESFCAHARYRDFMMQTCCASCTKRNAATAMGNTPPSKNKKASLGKEPKIAVPPAIAAAAARSPRTKASKASLVATKAKSKAGAKARAGYSGEGYSANSNVPRTVIVRHIIGGGGMNRGMMNRGMSAGYSGGGYSGGYQGNMIGGRMFRGRGRMNRGGYSGGGYSGRYGRRGNAVGQSSVPWSKSSMVVVVAVLLSQYAFGS